MCINLSTIAKPNFATTLAYLNFLLVSCYYEIAGSHIMYLLEELQDNINSDLKPAILLFWMTQVCPSNPPPRVQHEKLCYYFTEISQISLKFQS